MTMPEELSSLIKEGNFNPDQLEVVENGQKVNNNRMDPTIMNFLMLASVASQAVKIRKYFDKKTSDGRVVPDVLPIKDVLYTYGINHVAQSVAMLNDGPNEVGIWVNNPEGTAYTCAVGETYQIEFDHHLLKVLYFRCNPGHTAQVRLSMLS